MSKDDTGHATVARPINRRSALADGSKKIQARIKCTKLNHLRNDLDLYHRRVCAWIDNKELPSAEEIKRFGKEIIQQLQDRKILRKEEIRNIKLSETELTPRRSCSASPDRTPQSDRKSRHATHYAKTEEVNDRVRKRIDFDDEEEHQDIKVKDLKDAKISFEREIEYKEEIERLRQQIIQLKGLMKHQCSVLENELEKVKPTYLQKENSILKMKASRLENENASLKSCLPTELRKLEDQVKHYQLHLSSLREENTSMKTHLEKMVQKVNRYRAERNDLQEQKKQSSCFHCTSNKIHVERYKAERDAAVQERNTLIRALQRYRDRESELTLPNSCFHQDMEYLNQKLNNAEADIKHYKMENDALHNTIENQKKMILEVENRRRSPQVVTDPENCQNCSKYRNEISDLKREVNDLRDRLRKAAEYKFRDNNPNIVDLTDRNRPTRLAEKFSSLYTDEYTDTMEVIEESMDEAGCVRVMLTWLKSCYDWCEKLVAEQKDLLTTEAIGFMAKYHGEKIDLVISDRCSIYVNEFQKKIAADSLEAVGKICHVKSVKQDNLMNNKHIIKYIKKCTELCWMMQISDPPLYLNFDVNVGENLDINMYNVFTHSGSKIEYLVWPILYLNKTGPMLAKGVVQGM